MKKGKFQEGGGLNAYGILRAWASNAIWIFRRQGGVKLLKLSVIVYGYFLELPNLQYTSAANPKLFSFMRNLTSNSSSATRSSVFDRHVEE